MFSINLNHLLNVTGVQIDPQILQAKQKKAVKLLVPKIFHSSTCSNWNGIELFQV